MQDLSKDVLTFWNSRAGLGRWAGSRDVIAKQLEIEAIASYVTDGMHLLDVGCGNGITAMELARRYDIHVTGIDYAEEMIDAARVLAAGQRMKGSVNFKVNDVKRLHHFSEKFDLIYTERTLINLPDWASQKEAIVGITSLLKNGGAYLMCENSQDALDRINDCRERIGLPRINPPWHNCYFHEADVQKLHIHGVRLEHTDCFSSTYYFLSRIVNAWLAQEQNREPEYEASINHLALKLPSFGDMGQVKIWYWRKCIE
ncbi:MAG: methyltransferase domain-containing protein [Deltaproteobacteria bacterium]|nr:methyltransferase domain-containing protein [Deltaproteobacteria bacterium]